jgi:glycosyltransferase involved in cell wall biosynthesis
MKIAFDHQTFTMQRYGGISRYFSKLALEFHGMDQQVKVFAGIYQNHYLSKLPPEIVKGNYMANYPKKTGTIFNYFNHFLTQGQIQNYSPDILHETYYAFAKPKKNKAPRVVTAYDMIHEIFPESFPKNDPLTHRKKAAFQRADHIISISQSTKEDMIRLFGIPEEKISVVHLAADLPQKNSGILKKQEGKPFILFVGARDAYKNFNAVLRAVASSTSLKKDFDILAFGGGGFSEQEKGLISQLGLASTQVRQIGGDDEILAGLYQTASAFVYPSLYEGFGLPPLEAMGYGCPVISSNTSSMPEVIGEAAEFFNPESVDDLSAAMERVLYSQERKALLIEKGKKRMMDFSWNTCAKETLAIYNQLV